MKKTKKSLSPIFEERRKSKRRLLKLAEESSSSSKAEDELSTIGANPINLAEPTIQLLAPQATRLAQRGITIREPTPQVQQAQEVVPEGKGKKKLKKGPIASSRDSTPSLLRRVRREAEKNKLREQAWL